jgi:hypothetical protein
MRDRRDLSVALLAHSSRSRARSLSLLATSAARLHPPTSDPGRRAAALGPSLARAVMRRAGRIGAPATGQ